MSIKTTTVETITLSNVEINTALALAAARKAKDATGAAEVTVSRDNAWEAEGKNMYTATVTFTTVSEFKA